MSSKNKKEMFLSYPSYGCGYVIWEDAIGLIVGRVLTIIESIGLSNKQEEAVKSLIKQAIYEDCKDYVYIDETLHSAIHKVLIEQKRNKNYPVSAITLENIK